MSTDTNTRTQTTQNWRKLAIRIGLIAAIPFVISAAQHVPASAPATVPTAAPERITEDDPRWDCRTMGNHICGPRNTEGRPDGCYSNGRLVIAWTNHEVPSSDPLWARETPAC